MFFEKKGFCPLGVRHLCAFDIFILFYFIQIGQEAMSVLTVPIF
jgi:hypothetical protein